MLQPINLLLQPQQRTDQIQHKLLPMDPTQQPQLMEEAAVLEDPLMFVSHCAHTALVVVVG